MKDFKYENFSVNFKMFPFLLRSAFQDPCHRNLQNTNKRGAPERSHIYNFLCLVGGGGSQFLMLSHNLLKSKIPMSSGGRGFHFLMQSLNLLKSKIFLCPRGGGGGGIQFLMRSTNLQNPKFPMFKVKFS